MPNTTCRLDPEQEQQLLEGLLHADDAAWRRFHQLYDRLIYRCIRKVTRSFPKLLDRDDEREIFSNLLLALLSNDRHKLRCFDPKRGSRLSTWLGLLATHAAYDYLRALRREVPRVPLEQAEGTRWLGDSPLEQVERHQERRLADRLTRPAQRQGPTVRVALLRGRASIRSASPTPCASASRRCTPRSTRSRAGSKATPSPGSSPRPERPRR